MASPYAITYKTSVNRSTSSLKLGSISREEQDRPTPLTIGNELERRQLISWLLLFIHEPGREHDDTNRSTRDQ